MHIAIILDGNRRYAKKNGIPSHRGHEKGVGNVENFLNWCKEIPEVKELTFYVFSVENFKRSKTEINYLFDLFSKEILKFLKSEHVNDIKFNFIGRKLMFPKKIQELMVELETKSKGKLTVNIAMAYSSRLEIVDAVKKIIESKTKMGDMMLDDHFSDFLYLKSEPDILIRTGGEKRLSNFMLWQMAYTELFFVDKLWPEFTREDLKSVIDEYHSRERRYGR